MGAAAKTSFGTAPVNDNSEPRLNKRYLALPHMLPPRGLNREASAAYVGLSPSKFDRLVADRRMPRPKRIDGRTVWDRFALDTAFEALSEDADQHRNAPWVVLP